MDKNTSKAEIHYIVLEASRPSGDVEKIINAIGEFQREIPFPINRQYEQEPLEVENGAVFIRLRKTSPKQRYDHELLEETGRMCTGVERHFSDEDRARLSHHFAGIAIINPIEAE